MRLQTWRIQTGVWLTYGLVSMLGALPYRHAYPVMLYFAGTALAAFLASFVTRMLCRRLFASRWRWPNVIAAIFVASYALGVVCSLAGATLEVLAGHVGQAALGWRPVVLAGVANGLSPAVVLLAWSALYLVVQHGQEVRVRERQLLLAESLARDAELKVLRYQLAVERDDPLPAREARLEIRIGGRTNWIDVDDIDWIEASGDYVTLHVNQRLHMLRESMDGIERRLDPARFARIHRSTIIALNRIQGLSLLPTRDAMVTLRDGTALRVSRRFRHRISMDRVRML